MLLVNKLNNHPFVITTTTSWNREAMTALNAIVINLHTRFTENLYNLPLQWLSAISLGILLNSTLFPLLYCSDLAWVFPGQITLFSNLMLTTLTIASSLLICWLSVDNFVIVSKKLEIWSRRFRRSESTITFPLRLIIYWTRSAFLSALIALSHKLNRLLDVLLSTIMLINERLDKSAKGRGTS